MKILLLGEFSGLQKNLQAGLKKIGFENVNLLSFGDGFKNIKGDFDCSSEKSGVLGKIERYVKLFKILPKLKNYDVVQIISPEPFTRKFKINEFLLNYIFKHNKKVFLLGAGAMDSDSVIADFMQKDNPTYYDIVKKKCFIWSQSSEGRIFNEKLREKISGFIPIMYEYAGGYREICYKKLYPTIALPLDMDNITYEKNILHDKLVIFHGLNREDEKGTPFIKEAMERLAKKYPDKVKCVCDGKMPLEDYIKLLKKSNVVVEQAHSHSIGMNGVFALSLGKIVLGGGKKEFLDEYNLTNSPLIPIYANADDIYNKLEELVFKNAKEIEDMGRNSREFAENVFCAKKIAKSYANTWAGGVQTIF